MAGPRMLLAVLVIAGAALLGAVGGVSTAANPIVNIGISDGPDPVSLGRYVAYTFTFQNTNKFTLNKVTLTAPAFDASASVPPSTSPFPLTYAAYSTSRGTCSDPSAGLPAVCSVGDLPSGSAQVTITLVFRTPAAMPSTGSSVRLSARLTAKERVSDNVGASHTDTFYATQLTTLGAVGDDSVTGFVPYQLGDALETGGNLDDVPAGGNVQKTKVEVPAQASAAALGAVGSVSEVAKESAPTPCPATSTCWSQTSLVTVPGTFPSPGLLQLAFRFDESEVPPFVHATTSKFSLYHDGSKVQPCSTPGVNLAVGCLISIEELADGDLLALAQGSGNGGWAAGAP